MNSDIKQVFQKSQDERKGITLFLGGNSISIVVRKFDTEIVEGFNREFDRIIIVLSRIDAVMGN